jgi:transcriptional regulator with XRE-family HTH domain
VSRHFGRLLPPPVLHFLDCHRDSCRASLHGRNQDYLLATLVLPGRSGVGADGREVTTLAPRRSPSARAWLLGTELRHLRNTAGLTGEEVATRLHWSASKVSRIETGKITMSAADLRRLLDLYPVLSPVRERLIGLGRRADQRGWWDAFTDATTDEYSWLIALEADAESESHFAPIVIPGLLQTADYALAITGASLLMASPGEVSQVSQVRIMRQRVLTRAEPLRLRVVIDESVLRRQIGVAETMNGQLRHLVEMAGRPNVSVYILPLGAGPHLALSGVFTIVRFPAEIAAGVVYLQNLTRDLFIEEEKQVHRYDLAFDRLLELALGEDESIALISQIANEGS